MPNRSTKKCGLEMCIIRQKPRMDILLLQCRDGSTGGGGGGGGGVHGVEIFTKMCKKTKVLLKNEGKSCFKKNLSPAASNFRRTV